MCILFCVIQTIDIDGEIDKISVDLSSLELLDANTKQQLEDMANAINGIRFDDIETELKKSTVTADFSALKSSLTSAANTPGVPTSTQVNI